MHVLAAAALIVISVSGGALAQSSFGPHAMPHGRAGQIDHDMRGHSMQMQRAGVAGGSMTRASRVPTEPGQAAFAAIQEIVQILESDPRSDWSKIDIEALRQHLIDMNNVTLEAQIKNENIDGGMLFTVTGEGRVRDSIRRMVSAHAATMSGVDAWQFSAADIEGGATFRVLVPPRDLPKLRSLGFIGVMTRGMHHQEHHLMLARGEHPHGN
jgi:hypothetical protein